MNSRKLLLIGVVVGVVACAAVVALGGMVGLVLYQKSADSETDAEAAMAQIVAATLTASLPSPTSTPSHTPSPSPTNTSTPTNTPTITPTPGPTNTPRPTSTPRPSPTPQLGTERNPLPLGQTAEFDVKYVYTPLRVSFTVTEVLRGNNALQLVQEKGDLLVPLHPQEEFLLSYVKMDYLQGPADERQDFWGLLDFALKTESGNLIQQDSMLNMQEFRGEGYPPLHVEGWTLFRIRKESELPSLAYWPRLWFSVQSGIETPMIYLSLDE
jgi:hypothetical protein